MASAVIAHSIFSVSLHSPRCYNYINGTLALNPSQSSPPNSLLKLKKQSMLPVIQINKLNSRRILPATLVFASQSNIMRGIYSAAPLLVLQTVLKVGKDGVEAGTNLVPGMMGLIYLAFIALNKDEGPKGGGGGGGTTSTEDSLEEARRIMEKYK